MLKKFDILIYLIIFVLLTIYISCSKSTIIDSYKPRDIDTSVYTPRVKSDTTNKQDSLTPITFTVTVEGWEEIIINNG